MEWIASLFALFVMILGRGARRRPSAPATEEACRVTISWPEGSGPPVVTIGRVPCGLTARIAEDGRSGDPARKGGRPRTDGHENAGKGAP
ncbi:MAG: hypothetical protein AB1578_09190 [Thermodesulfobacteriota bacterium]